MPVTTRSGKSTEEEEEEELMEMDPLEHVVTVVFKQPKDGQLAKALERAGISEVFDVLTLNQPERDSLTYLSDDGTTPSPLSTGHKGMLKTFKLFVAFCSSSGAVIDDWTSVTKEDFDRFRISDACINATEKDNTFSPPAQVTSHVTAPKKNDPLTDFKRGIKRDASLFIVLKDSKQWDSWHRSTMAQARAQDVSEVLNHSYVPITGGEELFEAKQKYLYAVFERVLQTDKGKALVRLYEKTANAQRIFEELCQDALRSTRSSIDSSRILSYITSVRIGDGQWNGSTHSFILHWQEQVRLYESLVDQTAHFNSGQKMHMLQNAVHPLQDLRNVKNQADQLQAFHGKAIKYESYCNLLLSAASNYDAQYAHKGRTDRSAGKPARRSVYAHDLADFEEEDLSDTYNLDSDVIFLQANLHKQNTKASAGKAPRLTSQQWHSLQPEARATWDQLSDEAKAIILGLRKDPGKRIVNLHSISAYDYLQANMHDLQLGSTDDTDNTPPDPDDDHGDAGAQADDDSTELLAFLAKQGQGSSHPGHLANVLSTSKTKHAKGAKFMPKANSAGPAPSKDEELVINGKKYRLVHQHKIYYSVSAHKSRKIGSLVDRGANGGIAGEDVRIIEKSDRTVDVRGIDNHQITDIPIVTAGGVIKTQHGPAIAILHQYAYTGQGKTIHSSGQLEWYKNDVNDKSIKVSGGLQRILTNDGYAIPISIRDGLPYVALRPFTDEEWETLPHVILTGDADWDPGVLDHDLDDHETWFDAISDIPLDPPPSAFDEVGDYRKRVVVQSHDVLDQQHDWGVSESLVDACVMMHTYQAHTLDLSHSPASDLEDPGLDILPTLYESHAHEINKHTPDYQALRPMFGWLPADIIKQTFEVTTQYARLPMSTLLKKRYKSPFPALNVHRRDEPVATDTIYSDTPAVDSGATIAQVFVGVESLVTDVYAIKTDRQFINTLEDQIRTRGAPTKLISDRAQVEISNQVKEILRAYCIDDWQSEPHYQHQNFAERRIQQLKTLVNTIMDRVGAPPHTWFLCLQYVTFLLNSTFSAQLKCTPLFALTGSTNDISMMLYFYFWQPVYFKHGESTGFPSESKESRGHFVGFAENVGHVMTFKVLTDDTQKVLYRSAIRSAIEPGEQNLRLDPLGGEPPSFVKLRHDPVTQMPFDPGGHDQTLSPTEEETNLSQLPTFHPSDLVGRTFLLDPQEDGQRFRARIVQAIEDQDADLHRNSDRYKFLCSINDDQYEEILSYNEILNFIEQQDDDGTKLWKFRRITAHEGPLKPSDPSYKGSQYNVMIEWENGEVTSEPLTIIAADDPVTCAIYARENNLLDLDGWRRFKGIAKRDKKLLRMVNQAKLRSYRTAPRYKYGYEVPRDYNHAVELDKRNGNTKWQDSTALEMTQLHEYKTFKDLGKGAKAPDGYRKIRVHLVFDVKHDGRHKSRLVADGHLTEVPLDSVYSGVVSLRGLRLLVFLAELNDLDIWATDIGNAYLEAETQEKVYIIAGPEFGELEGHTLIIFKALYGLKTSGLCWHERLADCLRDMGFRPCKAEPDIWMRCNGNVYEYIAVYVDDIAAASKDPKAITDLLQDKYQFKLKGTGPISFHLGCDFIRDEDGTMCMSPRRYIEKLLGTYERIFGSKPKQNVTSPLEKGDHPELDMSEELDNQGIKNYQSIIGALQWAVSLGRIDITTAVMTLSGFRVAPRKGHMERAQRVVAYLVKMKHGAIRFRTEEPDFSALPDQQFDWAYTVYGDVKEAIPADIPEPLGKFVTLTHYVDANLYHDLITGRSVTGILHLVNKTPIDWYSKKQATVETATYGSEFIAARICVDQSIDLKNTLRYLGVPVRKKAYMFGDNKSVVDSSTVPHAKLHKRHNALSFHRVREAIAGAIIGFYHMDGTENPADILSKHWAYRQIWKLLQPLLFWKGDTKDIDVLDLYKAPPGSDDN